MTVPDLTFTQLAGAADAPVLLIVGPSLGTSAITLWDRAARLIDEAGGGVAVVGWDLPGHGYSPPVGEPFTVADLATVVRERTRELLAPGQRAAYAGVSLGGAVGFHLALDPGPFATIACLASAAKVGEPADWHARATLVRSAGTPVMVAGSAKRWFALGFIDRDPGTANRLLLALSDTDAQSYAAACEALAGYDLRAELSGRRVAPLVAPGEHDQVVTPELARATARLTGSLVHVLAGCGHLPPAEDPVAVADLLVDQLEASTDV